MDGDAYAVAAGRGSRARRIAADPPDGRVYSLDDGMLKVFELNEPAPLGETPIRAARTNELIVQGDYAYLLQSDRLGGVANTISGEGFSSRAGIYIFDVSDPREIVLISHTWLVGSPIASPDVDFGAMFVAEGRLFCANSGGEVFVFQLEE